MLGKKKWNFFLKKFPRAATQHMGKNYTMIWTKKQVSVCVCDFGVKLNIYQYSISSLI